jgi:hypothetical protein
MDETLIVEVSFSSTESKKSLTKLFWLVRHTKLWGSGESVHYSCNFYYFPSFIVTCSYDLSSVAI